MYYYVTDPYTEIDPNPISFSDRCHYLPVLVHLVPVEFVFCKLCREKHTVLNMHPVGLVAVLLGNENRNNVIGCDVSDPGCDSRVTFKGRADYNRLWLRERGSVGRQDSATDLRIQLRAPCIHAVNDRGIHPS